MKCGQIAIQLVRARGISSGLIAWWGCGWNGYSHADARLQDGTLLGARSDVIGGKPAGIQIRPAFYDPTWVRRTLYWKDVPAPAAERWDELQREGEGIPYDKVGIWHLIIGHQPVVDGWWFCSGYQFSRLQRFGEISTDFCIPAQQCTPDDLAVILSTLHWNRMELSPHDNSPA